MRTCAKLPARSHHEQSTVPPPFVAFGLHNKEMLCAEAVVVPGPGSESDDDDDSRDPGN